jgi:hypothetical protein
LRIIPKKKYLKKQPWILIFKNGLYQFLYKGKNSIYKFNGKGEIIKKESEKEAAYGTKSTIPSRTKSTQ